MPDVNKDIYTARRVCGAVGINREVKANRYRQTNQPNDMTSYRSRARDKRLKLRWIWAFFNVFEGVWDLDPLGPLRHFRPFRVIWDQLFFIRPCHVMSRHVMTYKFAFCLRKYVPWRIIGIENVQESWDRIKRRPNPTNVSWPVKKLGHWWLWIRPFLILSRCLNFSRTSYNHAN